MQFIDLEKPDIRKPIVIAAMQDMGNVGNIVIDFINDRLKTVPFRRVLVPYPSYVIDKATTARTAGCAATVLVPYPSYVIDKGGYIDYEQEKWEYRYGNEGRMVVFGGGSGQPQTNQELYDLCQEVVDTAKRYSAQWIYTVGAFHTSRRYGKNPKTLVTATDQELSESIQKLGFEATPGMSYITGFNGLILGLAKENGLNGIGLYAEIDNPQIPQYRSAKSALLTLEKLTYQKFGSFSELDQMASEIEENERRD